MREHKNAPLIGTSSLLQHPVTLRKHNHTLADKKTGLLNCATHTTEGSLSGTASQITLPFTAYEILQSGLGTCAALNACSASHSLRRHVARTERGKKTAVIMRPTVLIVWGVVVVVEGTGWKGGGFGEK